VRNALKKKEIGKTPEPSVRKRIEGKGFAEFFWRKNGAGERMVGMPEALQDAARLPHKDCTTGVTHIEITSTGIRIFW
jgi:hypothetical protein